MGLLNELIEVTLHGGPWHGRRVELAPEMGDEFFIPGLVPDTPSLEEDAHPKVVGTRWGLYTRVRHYPQGQTPAFEWSGWKQ